MASNNDDSVDRNDEAANSGSAIERFFRGLNEFIFHSKLGVADVQLVDYVSEMMLRFVRMDSLYSLRRSDGQRAKHVFQMICDSQKRKGLARREVNRQIGDFTLFWSGMFPESLERQNRSPDGLLDYRRQGKRAYAIAAEIQGGDERPPAELLFRLSEQFEMCAYGLREVRRQWEEGDHGNDLLIN
ncbi:hypothetical protein [Stieleria varia]|uniref:Uncharacterized protein n=1 Tax=Stieleria varia TaxID=2528005 RepID=A0A5C5ZUR4_9BACT|nr:hypothetical protein [Stieleria varia]TWT91304.1 hypothetical protein Pla52n_66380 [Stieleria varia]